LKASLGKVSEILSQKIQIDWGGAQVVEHLKTWVQFSGPHTHTHKKEGGKEEVREGRKEQKERGSKGGREERKLVEHQLHIRPVCIM
jgi:hypothetical protein